MSETLADILSGPDFQAFESGLLVRVLTRLWERFWGWVDDLFPAMPETQAGFLTALIVAVCLGAAALLVLRSVPDARPQSGRRDPGGGTR